MAPQASFATPVGMVPGIAPVNNQPLWVTCNVQWTVFLNQTVLLLFSELSCCVVAILKITYLKITLEKYLIPANMYSLFLFFSHLLKICVM